MNELLQNLILLAATALLTGLLVPYINSKIADNKFKKQKLFEAEIARQNKIIESQNELLSELERLLNTFKVNAVAVAWHKIKSKDNKLYQKYKDEYEDKIWEFFVNLEITIGKSGRLSSSKIQGELGNFMKYIEELDIELVKLIKNSDHDEEWKQFINKFKTEYALKQKQLIGNIANEFKLFNRIG